MISLALLIFIATSLASFIATIAYALSTLRGAIAPNRITWFFWCLAPMIGSIAMIARGEGYAVVPVFLAGFGPLFVLLATFGKKASPAPLTRFDYLCGFFSFLALLLWGITHEPLVAICFSIIADFFAAVPTLRKAWHNPKSEQSWPFSTGAIGAAAIFLVIENITLSAVLFPLYIILLDSLIVIFIHRGYFLKK